jgi:hypothetical protein
MHGVGYVKSKYNSILSPEGHEGVGMRKEKVPVDVIEAYDALEAKLKELDIGSLDFGKIKKELKLFGIAYAMQIGQAIKETLANMPVEENEPHPIDLPELTAYFDVLNQPDYDHPTLRTGREVILTQADLAQESIDRQVL